MKKYILTALFIVSLILSTNNVFAITDSNENDAFSEKETEAITSIVTQKPNMSVVEKMFSDKYKGEDENFLQQVGYDLFVPQTVTNTATTGEYDNDYKLSVGEKVSIYSYGDSADIMALSGSSLLSPVMSSQVDSKGNIFIQGIGLVPAENRTISEVETSLNKMASAKYKNLNHYKEEPFVQ